MIDKGAPALPGRFGAFMRYGAAPNEWAHFSAILGLTEDLLPVVSNPNATISPRSKMKTLGKTPSRYNGARQAVGIADWTQGRATAAQVAAWSKEEDYGICIQTRHIRALDVDVPDPVLARHIRDRIELRLQGYPYRVRRHTGKFLCAFALPGDFAKRAFKVEGGIVEFLATGQQFVAAGTHPSGSRYEWEGGLPAVFPEFDAEQFEALWQDLVTAFATEAPSERGASLKKQKLMEAHTNDPRAQFLLESDLVLNTERDGRMHIVCPFADEHTGDSGESATTYWPAHTGGYVRGHYACLHAHCEGRTDAEFDEAIGYEHEANLDDFEDISDRPLAEPPRDTGVYTGKFAPISAAGYAVLQPTEWIVRDVIPLAEIGVVFGEPASGKTFAVLDLGMSVARNAQWRDKAVYGGRVVYVAAEGAAGLRKRLVAYSEYFGVDLAGVPLDVIAASPNLLQRADVKDLATSIRATGGAKMIIIDTFAQATPGGNENSGEDVGKALAHCRAIHKATGAMVLLVHHSGKDTTKGARGWSGLRAAVDVEIEVVRFNHERALCVGKQKDGEDGAEFAFKLVTVDLGEDEEDEPVTSCVVAAANGVSGGRRQKRLDPLESMVMHVAKQLLPLGDEGMREGDLIQAVVDQLTTPEEGKRDHRVYNTGKAIERLIVEGYLEKNAGLITTTEGD